MINKGFIGVFYYPVIHCAAVSICRDEIKVPPPKKPAFNALTYEIYA